MSKFYKIQSATEKLFENRVELLPSVTELFEYELAYLEYQTLLKKDYLQRTAYAKSFDNKDSIHFLRYSEIPKSVSDNRSTMSNSYFKNGLFSTGYATHSLFPYRGKFHPQLIKGLINILGIKKGETILDPMAGSGTTNVEAALMGINSYAIDVSPFCQLMIKTKYEALSIDLKLLQEIKLNSNDLFEFFIKGNIEKKLGKVDKEKQKIYDLAFLAFLDALGYSKRVVRSNHKQLFEKVLTRYIETVKSFIQNKYFDCNIGQVNILEKSNALKIELDDNFVDGIITSPPYSFAIDYVENDKDQLEYLGINTNELKKDLIGLKGKGKNEKLETYFSDMDRFCNEASRVLKKNKYLVIIIGSNTNQTGGIRLEQTVIDSARNYGLKLVKSILKPIKGMRNTMKEEYILIFEKK
ncbi:MAG: hypothetical protein L3J41_12530 [Melioribacteraceae bacterium]|nr:hypothetical protein [Melioribacteraceae bacterium]